MIDKLRYALFDQKIRFVAKEKVKPGEYPFCTVDDKNWFKISNPNYINGFWPGILIEGYKVVKDEEFLDFVRKWTSPITIANEDKDATTSVRFFYSHAALYDATKETESKEKALETADFFVQRFNPELGFIPISVNNERASLAPTMADVVPFLWWAYKVSENEKYEETAYKHAQAILKLNVRNDGSVREQAIIDPETGEISKERNNGALRDSSTIARVQAQTLVGLVETLKHRQDEEMLKSSFEVADFFTHNLPEDFIPYYEFGELPQEYRKKDSSAAAIGAYGLIDLSRISGVQRFADVGRQIRRSLITKYLSADKSYPGLLKHGCFNLKKSYYADNSLIFGDYYFVKLLNQE